MDLHSPRVHERDLRGISLCAGYGGLDLGLHIAEPGYRTVAYVEREAHAAATLVARMEDASLGQAPIWDDLKSFDGRPWRGRVHIVSAGYPCQPFSRAGKRRGSDDPRHLWPDVARVIGETDPEWVFCENVEGHIDLGLADVADCLRGMGYTPKAGLFTAREAGASHRRRRIFILAHADRNGCGLFPGSDDRPGADADDIAPGHREGELRPVRGEQCGADLDAVLDRNSCAGASADGDAAPLFAPGPGDLPAWAAILDRDARLQPAILRTSDGLADRVERTRAAGNGVCSMAAAIAWRTLTAAHRGEPPRARGFVLTDA
ncbi:C-5 cytosine-specific DNA methylase [Sphingobium wenxiniae]|uniref:DNA (cytosine-5-)-methyltransferase n=1 Tax=Sphingobium wenxiniae (strain DSM 21828 / CGMCC 1.7748 / JZ-1) TaxID=595605 RepID=A0A562KKP1_SPHWJ|nr:C-5 cytosine-specific DNA methylase [Sphingobium wenxiniae]